MDIHREVIATGELAKQGHKVKSWLIRRFILSGTNLDYFDENGYKRGAFDITNCAVSKKSPEECEESTATHAFALTGPGKQLMLNASNDNNRDAWMRILSKHIRTIQKDELKPFLYRREKIAGHGIVRKKNIMNIPSSFKMVVTNYPRCLLIEPTLNILREEICWNASEPPKFEATDADHFKVVLPYRTYIFKDVVNHSDFWDDVFNSISSMGVFRQTKTLQINFSRDTPEEDVAKALLSIGITSSKDGETGPGRSLSRSGSGAPHRSQNGSEGKALSKSADSASRKKSKPSFLLTDLPALTEDEEVEIEEALKKKKLSSTTPSMQKPPLPKFGGDDRVTISATPTRVKSPIRRTSAPGTEATPKGSEKDTPSVGPGKNSEKSSGKAKSKSSPSNQSDERDSSSSEKKDPYGLGGGDPMVAAYLAAQQMTFSQPAQPIANLMTQQTAEFPVAIHPENFTVMGEFVSEEKAGKDDGIDKNDNTDSTIASKGVDSTVSSGIAHSESLAPLQPVEVYSTEEPGANAVVGEMLATGDSDICPDGRYSEDVNIECLEAYTEAKRNLKELVGVISDGLEELTLPGSEGDARTEPLDANELRVNVSAGEDISNKRASMAYLKTSAMILSENLDRMFVSSLIPANDAEDEEAKDASVQAIQGVAVQSSALFEDIMSMTSEECASSIGSGERKSLRKSVNRKVRSLSRADLPEESSKRMSNVRKSFKAVFNDSEKPISGSVMSMFDVMTDTLEAMTDTLVNTVLRRESDSSEPNSLPECPTSDSEDEPDGPPPGWNDSTTRKKTIISIAPSSSDTAMINAKGTNDECVVADERLQLGASRLKAMDDTVDIPAPSSSRSDQGSRIPPPPNTTPVTPARPPREGVAEASEVPAPVFPHTDIQQTPHTDIQPTPHTDIQPAQQTPTNAGQSPNVSRRKSRKSSVNVVMTTKRSVSYITEQLEALEDALIDLWPIEHECIEGATRECFHISDKFVALLSNAVTRSDQDMNTILLVSTEVTSIVGAFEGECEELANDDLYNVEAYEEIGNSQTSKRKAYALMTLQQMVYHAFAMLCERLCPGSSADDYPEVDMQGTAMDGDDCRNSLALMSTEFLDFRRSSVHIPARLSEVVGVLEDDQEVSTIKKSPLSNSTTSSAHVSSASADLRLSAIFMQNADADVAGDYLVNVITNNDSHTYIKPESDKVCVAEILIDLKDLSEFDPTDILKRPDGWEMIRGRKIDSLESDDRLMDVPESSILLMRPRRIVEQENSMLNESVTGSVKYYE
jgi:hypothetical protein